MTTREVYEYILIELNNVNFLNGTLYLEDFNYFMNRAVHEYINRRYNLYNTTQQTTDDLQVITSNGGVIAPDSGILRQLTRGDRDKILTGITDFEGNVVKTSATWIGRQQSVKFTLPEDYYHLLGSMLNYDVLRSYKCYPSGSIEPFGATRITSDQYSKIVRNAFLKPDYKRPYYYITDTGDTLQPDAQFGLNVADSGDSGVYGNRTSSSTKSQPSVEYRLGELAGVFDVNAITFDYIRTPATINLTTAQRDNNEDTSQVMEFPDYVINEIIKIAVSVIMSQQADPRLQTYVPVNSSVPNQVAGGGQGASSPQSAPQ